MRSKIQWSTHPGVLFNPLILVVTKEHTQTKLEVSVKFCLSMYDLLLPPGTLQKDVLKIFKEQSHEIRSVPPAVFLEKVVLEIFRKFLENHLRQLILKAHNYAEYELCRWYFSSNFPKIFRIAILKENLINVPYFIKEHLWMSASDEATPQKNFGGIKPTSKLTLKT